MRRVGETMVYTRGFHPKPDMSFGPALSLGVLSLDEFADIRLARDLGPEEVAHLVAAMTASSPAGLVFSGGVKLVRDDPGITRMIAGARYLLAFARGAVQNGKPAEEMLAARCLEVMAATTLPYRREIEGLGKVLDVRSYLQKAEVAGPEAMALLGQAGLVGDMVAVDVEVVILPTGAVKAAELAAVIAGDGLTAPPHRAVRAALFGADELGRFSPLETGRGRRAKPVAVAPAEGAAALADAG
jgi:radical SAM-linked protein